MVADGGIEHLAGANEILEPPHLLVDGSASVELVQEQDVHPVGVEPSEARFDGPGDVAA